MRTINIKPLAYFLGLCSLVGCSYLPGSTADCSSESKLWVSRVLGIEGSKYGERETAERMRRAINECYQQKDQKVVMRKDTSYNSTLSLNRSTNVSDRYSLDFK